MKRYKVAYIGTKGEAMKVIEVWGNSKSDAIDVAYGIIRAILGGNKNPYEMFVYSVIYSNGVEKVFQTVPDRMYWEF